MPENAHKHCCVLTTLPVSPNHATLNQSLIFFSHIVNTTGSHKYLSRFLKESFSVSFGSCATQQVSAHQYNKRSTPYLQIIFVSKFLICAVDESISLLLTQRMNGITSAEVNVAFDAANGSLRSLSSRLFSFVPPYPFRS